MHLARLSKLENCKLMFERGPRAAAVSRPRTHLCWDMDSGGMATAADPISLVKAATETFVKITGQNDQQFQAAGQQLNQELDTDKTIAMWKSYAEGSGDSSVSEGRSAVYRWAASKMGEGAKFEDVTASVAAALKDES